MARLKKFIFGPIKFFLITFTLLFMLSILTYWVFWTHLLDQLQVIYKKDLCEQNVTTSLKTIMNIGTREKEGEKIRGY